jgi:hypothetical protein
MYSGKGQWPSEWDATFFPCHGYNCLLGIDEWVELVYLDTSPQVPEPVRSRGGVRNSEAGGVVMTASLFHRPL